MLDVIDFKIALNARTANDEMTERMNSNRSDGWMMNVTRNEIEPRNDSLIALGPKIPSMSVRMRCGDDSLASFRKTSRFELKNAFIKCLIEIQHLTPTLEPSQVINVE